MVHLPFNVFILYTKKVTYKNESKVKKLNCEMGISKLLLYNTRRYFCSKYAT